MREGGFFIILFVLNQKTRETFFHLDLAQNVTGKDLNLNNKQFQYITFIYVDKMYLILLNRKITFHLQPRF